jgi:uncharacterized membrane protein YgdD (TMEM256/DUF423 family)
MLWHIWHYCANRGTTPVVDCQKLSAWCLQLGIIIFSGSLYAMTLGAPRWFGAITPIGGTAFIVGWLWLAYVSWQQGN